MSHRPQVGGISDTWLADLTIHKRHCGKAKCEVLNEQSPTPNATSSVCVSSTGQGGHLAVLLGFPSL